MPKPATRLLLAEDNEANADMLSRRLLKRGFELNIARDGRQALEMALQLAPDIILLDMSLPEMDGWTVARALKSDARTHFIPILALTAHAMLEDRDKALQAGCDDYDTKPVDLVRLLEKIERLLRGAFLPAGPEEKHL